MQFVDADEDDGVLPSETVRVSRPVQQLTAQLHDYFTAGREIRNVEGVLDFSICTDFQRRVYRAALNLSVGETVSYSELAKRVDCPGGARAVGHALARNPFLVVVPCHRILGANGALGGFSGGVERKQALLALENSFR